MARAWTSGINLYATVTVLGLLQKFGATKLPGGLDVLDNWWIIGIAGGLYLVEFFADKIPYVDSVWDVVHTFIRVPAGAVVAYAATNHLDPTYYIPAALIGGGLAFASHGTKAAAPRRSQPLTRTCFQLGSIDSRRRDRLRRSTSRSIRSDHYHVDPRDIRGRVCVVFPEDHPGVNANDACRGRIFQRQRV